MAGDSSSTGNPSGVRGISPEGWHIPSNQEIQDLIGHVKSIESEYPAASLKMDWAWPGYTTNITGFSAQPSGFVKSVTGKYGGLFNKTIFWTCTELDEDNAYIMRLSKYTELIENFAQFKGYGFSVRCVKDE